MRARALNAKADREARAAAVRRAAGSNRQQCSRRREAAFEWEKRAHQSLRLVADRWAAA